MAVRERVRMIRDGWLIGAPDLAVEILSPSNSPREMLDRERTMFAGGCRQFWIVDGTKRTVRTSTPGGQPKTYESGESIPLDLFDSHAVAVDDIFIEP
jgi:Uma2 family endonuclease